MSPLRALFDILRPSSLVRVRFEGPLTADSVSQVPGAESAPPAAGSTSCSPAAGASSGISRHALPREMPAPCTAGDDWTRPQPRADHLTDREGSTPTPTQHQERLNQ